MSDPKTLVINLKIIGSIDSGIKLNTREKYFTLDNVNWYQGLRRFYRRDDRSVTYEKISYLIRNVRDLLESKTDGPRSLGLENEKELREYLSPILEDAQRGLRSLQLTYEDDRTFTSQIEVEIATIDRLLGPFRSKYSRSSKTSKSSQTGTTENKEIESSVLKERESSILKERESSILKEPFERPSKSKKPRLTGIKSAFSSLHSENVSPIERSTKKEFWKDE